MLTLGITGTDTGVGKTTVACAILAMLGERGISTAAMKPVETGVADDDGGSDAARLQSVATTVHPLDVVRPYRFDQPLAPMAAADLEGEPIALEALDRAFQLLRNAADVIVVEGAGGALVPLTDSISIADLFRRWSLDVIIVAANRLGVLNHALLTERVLRAAGCSVVGIVLVDAERADESSASNAQVLARLTSCPLFRFPRISEPFTARDLAGAARGAGLDALTVLLSPSSRSVR